MNNSSRLHDQSLSLNNSEMSKMNQKQVFNSTGCSVARNNFPFTPVSSHNTNVICTPQSTQSSFSDLGYHSSSSSQSHWTPQSINSTHYSDFSSPSSTLSTPPSIGTFPIIPISRYGSYNPGRILPINTELRKKTTSDRSTMWFFLLELLTDRTKKSVIAWTGKGKEFRIFNFKALTALWSRENRTSDVASVKKNIRNCYRERILRVTNVKLWTFEFITEPSIHLKNTTRKMMDIYIALNHINGPLTIGSPIDFPLPSWRFPRGKILKVDRVVPLRDDGTPVQVSHQQEYCVVDLVEDDFR
ncbi:hypothetical protein PRIPAC_74794 [Pristionchus pacificus]|uniref:ETS domain-containing protein n=1 Tax=Pristionchus pacificus TaxID=54126 RepID=A0A2A6CSH5_PRIPA|nr:hypothetical protein PRIPAC_74794 [Pristionchus pacificus]|eukprot:PDM80993.1 hypothetical protein PRIPAC_35996 [Pristionchus pacificus]